MPFQMIIDNILGTICACSNLGGFKSQRDRSKMVEIIWFNQNIPRHSFIGDSNCVFCRNALESRDHLFFNYFFTKRIQGSVMRLCLVSNRLFSWEDLIEWVSSNLKGKGMRSNICRLGLWATVYHIWLQRNAIIHRGHIKTEEQIIKL